MGTVVRVSVALIAQFDGGSATTTTAGARMSAGLSPWTALPSHTFPGECIMCGSPGWPSSPGRGGFNDNARAALPWAPYQLAAMPLRP
ncbi:MAG TPA: hypothetical protein VMS00_09980 [Acidimicrobiales bacterium]|nr:hypothetical protein [Acidimicrobiales bacterium]